MSAFSTGCGISSLLSKLVTYSHVHFVFHISSLTASLSHVTHNSFSNIFPHYSNSIPYQAWYVATRICN